jgi:hypothetical protein
LFFPYKSVISAFARVGINAFFDEDTPDHECQKKVDQWKELSEVDRKKVPSALLEINYEDVQHFMASLQVTVARQIERIIILPLHGGLHEVITVVDAVKFIESYEESSSPSTFERYEIQIRFNKERE